MLRPSYRRAVVLQPEQQEEHLSEYSKRQVNFGELGDPCWIVDLRYPQEHRNTEMDWRSSYFFANCPHVVDRRARKSVVYFDKVGSLLRTQPVLKTDTA